MARCEDIRELEANLSGAGLRVGVVMSRFNEDVGEGLLSGCESSEERSLMKNTKEATHSYKQIRSMVWLCRSREAA